MDKRGISGVRRSRPILCKNCKSYIGISENQKNQLCWRKKQYTDATGLQKVGEFCNELNKNYDCKDYKVKWFRFISAYFA